jgi:hypothetical protein
LGVVGAEVKESPDDLAEVGALIGDDGVVMLVLGDDAGRGQAGLFVGLEQVLPVRAPSEGDEIHAESIRIVRVEA